MMNKIVHVLSTNYAGSHLLTLQLGSHTHCLSIGEFHHFRWQDQRRSKACYLCSDDSICPVYQGLVDSPLEQLYPKLFANIQRYNPTVSTVIDNSKKTRWIQRFLEMSDYKQYYIHLIRDPRALVRRWILTEDTPEKKRIVKQRMMRRCWKNAWSLLRGDEINVYIVKWLYQNQLITNFLQNNHLNYKLVTYHDLVNDADQVLQSLTQWVGHEYEPEQKFYWKFEHHSTVKPAYMQPPDEDKSALDVRWKSFLSPEIQERITMHPKVNRYLTELGLTLADEGIIAKDRAASAEL